MITANSRVTIGRFTSISGPNTDIVANIHPVNVGAFTSIARNVTIQESNHRLDRVTTFNINANVIDGDVSKDTTSKGSIEIGNDVWIGAQCVILSGTKIGNGSVIAANSTVTSDIPPYAIAGGSPAKVISYRFSSDIIEALEKLKWWEWPVEKIKANKQFFEGQPGKESIQNLLHPLERQ
jgi:virginiamycin A acetyltransferase